MFDFWRKTLRMCATLKQLERLTVNIVEVHREMSENNLIWKQWTFILIKVADVGKNLNPKWLYWEIKKMVRKREILKKRMKTFGNFVEYWCFTKRIKFLMKSAKCNKKWRQFLCKENLWEISGTLPTRNWFQQIKETRKIAGHND